MPFDPAYPVHDTPLRADEMRAQLNALNDKIDAVPAGPPGPPGPPGDPGPQGPQGEPGGSSVPTLDAVLAEGADANARTIGNVGTLQVAFLMPVNGQPIQVGADLVLNEKHVTYVGNFLTVGVVKLLNLPTADPLTAGQLWNDNGTLKVSAG